MFVLDNPYISNPSYGIPIDGIKSASIRLVVPIKRYLLFLSFFISSNIANAGYICPPVPPAVNIYFITPPHKLLYTIFSLIPIFYF